MDKTRTIQPVLQLTAKETGEQIRIPFSGKPIYADINFINAIWDFTQGNPVNEEYLYKEGFTHE